MDDNRPVLSLHQISKQFGPIKILREIDCDFYRGEVHCLIGENGAGKSTLIKILSGAHLPDSGTITLAGNLVENQTPFSARASGIGTIYQELDLLPNLTAAQNVFLGVEPRTRFGTIDHAALQERAATILSSLGADFDGGTLVADLAIARQQIVAIAKALTGDCQVLILDEPTAVFTKGEIDRLLALIRQMRTDGLAIIFISHHMEEIFEIGDRITVLRDGVVAATGPIANFTHDTLIRHMVGREIVRLSRTAYNGQHARVLEVNGLGDGRLVHDVSFHVARGEIVGVAGLVGAGRTEMARLLFGADRKAAGQVLMHGVPTHIMSPRQAMLAGIGMVPEDRKQDGLTLNRPAGENLAYSYLCKAARLGVVPWRRVRQMIDRSIQSLGVRPANANAVTLRLSGGNQQKLLLGRWLMVAPDLLILDEPTRGVDVGARTEIYRVLDGLRQGGLAILMISSDLTEILTVSDRILVMSRGQITGELPGATATEEAVLALALQNHTEAA